MKQAYFQPIKLNVLTRLVAIRRNKPPFNTDFGDKSSEKINLFLIILQTNS